jgi:hypothetical protein
MKDVQVPLPRLRTTTLTAPLRTYGVVTGMGSLPNEALDDLVKHAQERGTFMADKLPSDWPALTGIEPRDLVWFFEVVDVRIASGAADRSWLAYGTLIARSETPIPMEFAGTIEGGGWPEGYPWSGS